jgi:hypothetical protein
MGQINLPILNRVGYYNHWDSIWDNQYNYRKEFSKDIFLKNILILILDDRVLYSSFFNSNKFNISNFNKNLKFSTFLDNYKVNFTILAKKNLPFFHSRIWYIQYQEWLLVSLFIYNVINKTNVFFNESNLPNTKLYYRYYNFLYFLNNNLLKKYSNLSYFYNNFN